MMESCFAGKPDLVGPVEVGDIKRDLLEEFAAVATHLQDSVQSQAENLQVYLRVRPFTAAESDNRESPDCVTIEGPDTVVLQAPRSGQSNRQSEKPLPQTVQKFTFTQVFGPEASQRTVFDGSVRGVVRDVLQGGNCLVFTYGVTNAGKTFTFLGPDHDCGLLPRSLSVIFNSVEGRLYGRGDLKPQRCRDFSRLTPEQQAAESSSKKNLLRLFKESDRSLTSGRSAILEGSSLSDGGLSEADSFCLDVSPNVTFSVWVSFCQIYNDNVHDLLEQPPSGHKRTVLRLSQDVKGNSFIKDLRWVQVNSSEEAYRVMKIGRRNQSFSSTRLNQLSSRSHSIFSIRILRVDDVGVPRVLGISELALCDLAGSERCSRTNNTGERLKEAGNINSSLLTLGKCINAMRLNQNAKFQHHVPFRESKLTHLLQFFFCGAGRVSMVVNINRSSSCFDETLNVLKFSALAQKVVVPNARPAHMDDHVPHKAAMELSIIIDEAERGRNVARRRSSLVAWETSLEDVQEDESGEEWEEGEEEERTVLEAGGEEDQKPGQTAALRSLLEAQIREEVSTEFMELFAKMEKDFSERLEKEREILQERAERRLEILQSLVNKTDQRSAGGREEHAAMLDGVISCVGEDLMKIREDAQSAHRCLSAELEALHVEKQRALDQLQEAMEKLSELQEVCSQKDDAIAKLQQAAESAPSREEEESRKRHHDSMEDKEERGGPAKKRVVLEEEIWRLQEENDQKEETINELRERENRCRKSLEEEKNRLKELKKQQELLEQKVQMLSDMDTCPKCASVFLSLETEQNETVKLQKENKALVNGIFQLQTEVTGLKAELRQQTDKSNSLSEQVSTAKSRLQDLEMQSEKNSYLSSLTQEVEHLKQELKEEKGRVTSSVFHDTMKELKKESEVALQRSAQKSKQIQELQREKRVMKEELAHRCEQLRQELANQRSAFSCQLQTLGAELESEGGALWRRLEEMERSEEERRRQLEKQVSELQGLLLEKDRLLEDSHQASETLRRELQQLQEFLQRSEDKENKVAKEKLRERRLQEQEEGKRRLQEQEEGKRRLQEQEEGKRRLQEQEEGKRREFQPLKTETESKRETQDVPTLRSNMAERQKTPRTTGRKRKSCEVEDLVSNENKRNKIRNPRPNRQDKMDGTLQKVGEMIHMLPKTKTVVDLVGGYSAEKETVATATKPRRGRKKLFKSGVWSPLLDSPNSVLGGAEEEKESDHLIIRRQLRSKTCRK